MMGLEDIKKINKDPEAYYKSQESDGQARSLRKVERNLRSNRVLEETRD